MSKDDYVYIKRDRKYYKILKDNYDCNLPVSNYNKELKFLKENYENFFNLIISPINSFTLDERVYASNKNVNKNIKINEDIYDEFISICSSKFSYLKIQDIVSQCLLSFINQNKDL